MKIARKYSLDRIGQRYETITIEVDRDGSVEELIQQIDQAFKKYVEAIQNKVVT